VNSLQVTKTLYPSMDDRLLVEEWQLTNIGDTKMSVNIGGVDYTQTEKGYKGDYTFRVYSDADKGVHLNAGESYTFPVYHGALLNDEPEEHFDMIRARDSRKTFLKVCQQQLVMSTPDCVLDRMFYFAKIRAAESIFESSMGLVHSPGGGNYYVGIWANDQVEYSGPFFPLMGYATAGKAAYNTYQKFLENIPKDEGHIPYAFEVDGNFPMTHLDRGDAAMIAYGTSLYLLNAGKKNEVMELWPLIEWSIEYCHRMRNAEGAVQSESDEMEGRIPTGEANLSTSTLYYGGLKYAVMLARELGKSQLAKLYDRRAREMEQVIETYFGSTIEGLSTYRYFDGNQKLRHWICLPLTMGITQRKKETLAALFGTMWTDNGVLVEYDPDREIDEKQTFWDRATLYALRGALKVGATEVTMEKLIAYSRKRLLGDHVPYAVEAYPENNMKHLSAESALYARIYVEGVFGIEPAGFNRFAISPSLPKDWEKASMQQIYLGGKPYDIYLSKEKGGVRVKVVNEGQAVVNRVVRNGKPAYLIVWT
ncbi:MAG: six-hairpin glycosidase-like protein, partial [Bacteroidota bacterium]